MLFDGYMPRCAFAWDRYGQSALYGSPTSRWLFLRIILFQSHGILFTPTYFCTKSIASYLDSRSIPHRHGSPQVLAYVMQPIYGLLYLPRPAAEPADTGVGPAQSFIYISTCAGVFEVVYTFMRGRALSVL